MRRPENELMWFPAFAAMSSRAVARTVQHFRTWVARVAHTEYADELILAAAARELQVRPVIVPFNLARFYMLSISEYYEEAVEGRVVYLGNNDVHYVWLATSEDCFGIPVS